MSDTTAALKLAEEALQLAVHHARRRRQFGAPIASFQLVQARLADMDAAIAAARSLRARSIATPTLAPAARHVAVEAAKLAVDGAVQVHGSAGYTADAPVARLWRAAQALHAGEVPAWAPQAPDAAVHARAAEFAQRAIAPHVARMEADGVWPDGLFERFAEAGLLGAGIPEAYGGAGGSYMDLAVAAQAIARVSGAAALAYGAHVNRAHHVLAFGSEAQKAACLPRFCDGTWIAGLGISEAEAGSDLFAIATTARPEGGGFVIDGAKKWISNGPLADRLIVFARTQDAPEPLGLTAFLVDTGLPGVRRGAPHDTLGFRGAPACEVRFDGVRVEASDALGPVHGGHLALAGGVVLERGFFSCLALGIMEAAVAKSQDAQSAMRLEAARALVYEALDHALAGAPSMRGAAAGFLYATEQAKAAVDRAIWRCGPDMELDRAARDVKGLEILAGTLEMRRLQIAAELLAP